MSSKRRKKGIEEGKKEIVTVMEVEVEKRKTAEKQAGGMVIPNAWWQVVVAASSLPALPPRWQEILPAWEKKTNSKK